LTILQICQNHPIEGHHLIGTVLMKLPQLTQLSQRHCSHLDWFRANWHRLRLPPLFAEIFDIPKSSHDMKSL
jgi:nuclear receptor subfamily 1 group D protein 3